MINGNKFLVYRFIVLLILFTPGFYYQSVRAAAFTVVIDAGHGGHDPGAQGSFAREKDINLAVSLELGALISKNFDDVKVIYTRKTDKYLTLQERADIVNNNHADLFLCIHTNSSPVSSAYGAETFTLGLAKTKSNLDVAMRENSVILLEDDYKTKYRGFDPGSVDSYIMFEFMQDKYIDRSLDIASTIQKQFEKYAGRSDRGVRQAGFWVLHRSACPSVLVELGFISNPSEEKYLTSTKGRTEMATAIYNAFVSFKREHDKKSGKLQENKKYVEIPKPAEDTLKQEKADTNGMANTVSDHLQHNKTVSNANVEVLRSDEPKTMANASVTVYKVQLFASDRIIKAGSPEFKGLKSVEFFKENGLYKYTIGSETDYQLIRKVRKDVLSKFPTAFIIGFMGERKLSNAEIQSKIKR